MSAQAGAQAPLPALTFAPTWGQQAPPKGRGPVLPPLRAIRSLSRPLSCAVRENTAQMAMERVGCVPRTLFSGWARLCWPLQGGGGKGGRRCSLAGPHRLSPLPTRRRSWCGAAGPVTTPFTRRLTLKGKCCQEAVRASGTDVRVGEGDEEGTAIPSWLMAKEQGRTSTPGAGARGHPPARRTGLEPHVTRGARTKGSLGPNGKHETLRRGQEIRTQAGAG